MVLLNKSYFYPPLCNLINLWSSKALASLFSVTLLISVTRQMNDLRKGQDLHNREEIKLLSRQHRNRDELQRFVIPSCMPKNYRLCAWNISAPCWSCCPSYLPTFGLLPLHPSALASPPPFPYLCNHTPFITLFLSGDTIILNFFCWSFAVQTKTRGKQETHWTISKGKTEGLFLSWISRYLQTLFSSLF